MDSRLRHRRSQAAATRPGGYGVGSRSSAAAACRLIRAPQYTAHATIVVFSGEKPQDNVSAYDARDVMDRLRPTVQFGTAEG